MTETLVIAKTEGAIGTITICRPKALNALNQDVLTELLDAVGRLLADTSVRVVLLTGEGERSFIAGADISEFVGASPIGAMRIAERIKEVTDALVATPKPVVAVINGYCLGGGLELALACDIRIASSNAVLGLPEIKLGILPGGGGTVRLTKIAGSSVARMMTMTGDPISAERACALGLVASVHTPDELAAAATALATKLSQLPPFALGQLKSALNIAVDADTESACQALSKAVPARVRPSAHVLNRIRKLR